MSGSDGLRRRVIKLSDYVPVLIASAPEPPKTAIPTDRWPEVQTRYVAGESLRALAQWYGVLHEAIRGITQRPYRL